jgi:hypothetical protein
VGADAFQVRLERHREKETAGAFVLRLREGEEFHAAPAEVSDVFFPSSRLSLAQLTHSLIPPERSG